MRLEKRSLIKFDDCSVGKLVEARDDIERFVCVQAFQICGVNLAAKRLTNAVGGKTFRNQESKYRN